MIGNWQIQIMNRKKYIHKKENNLKNNVIFCAECGEELDLFGIDKVDVDKIRERHKRCREIGKFKGDKCAMLFIAQPEDFLPNEEEE